MTQETPWDGSPMALDPPSEWWATQRPMPANVITQQDIRDMCGCDGNGQEGYIRRASDPNGVMIPRRGIHHLNRKLPHEPN